MARRLFNASTLSYWIFALIGTFFVGLGLIVAVPTVVHLFTYAHAEGSVVDYRYDGDMVTPIVQFTTPDGRRWEFEGNVASYPPEFRLEQKVDVRYDPNQPRQAFVISFINWLLFPGIFLLIGGVFALIGWLGLFSFCRHRRVA